MNLPYRLAAALALTLVWCSTPIVYSQIDTEPISIPSTAVASVVVWPTVALDQPGLELFPHEIVTAWGQKELGIDPMNIEMILAMVDLPDFESEPEWGGLIRFAEPVVPGGNLAGYAEPETFLGHSSYVMNPGMRMVVVDSRHWVVGRDGFLEKMMSSSQQDSSLTKLMNRSLTKTSIHAFVDMAAIRPIIQQMIDPDEIPEPFRMFAELPDLINHFWLRQDLKWEWSAQLVMGAEAGKAEQLNKILQDGMGMGKSMLLSQLSQQMDLSDPVQQAIVQYVQRLADYVESQLQPKIEGDNLVFDASYGVSTIPVLVAMLLPAVQQVRSAAKRVESMNLMRQQMLAMHNYHDVYQQLPTNIYNDKGKALLSWRVQVLPFTEQYQLYEQFHLDEPWDSPHNIQLVEHMPQSLVNPDVPLEPGKTVFLAVAGENMTFGHPEKVTLLSITDGTSQTIALVEANPEAAVIWTKPEDFVPDPDDPLRGLGQIRPAGFNVALLDGSVRIINPNIARETLMQLFMPNDGGIAEFE